MSTAHRGSFFDTAFGTPAGGTWFSIVVAAMPAFFFLFLFIANPAYMSHFFSPDTRPVALPLLGLVFALSLLSFVLLRGCSAIIRSGRRFLGTMLATLVMAIVVFPAILLVLLGPAFLILLAAEL